jgi:hypothetical protein
VSYNIAWFSPKPVFTGITKVCWDINETDMSARKWTQVLFLDDADAHRYPVTAGSEHSVAPSPYRAASGGFDLGFTSPEFSTMGGPTTGVISGGVDGQHQTLAGFKSSRGLVPSWFQNGQFTTPEWGATADRITGLTDKAARYTHCLENQANNTVRLTQATASGTRSFDMPGQIPAGSTRVVFEDDNYNPPKDADYDASALTWHWDNIQIYSDSSVVIPPPPAAPAPSVSDSGAPAAGQAIESAAAPQGSTGIDRDLVTLVLLFCAVLAVGAIALVVLIRTGGFAGEVPAGPVEPDRD